MPVTCHCTIDHDPKFPKIHDPEKSVLHLAFSLHQYECAFNYCPECCVMHGYTLVNSETFPHVKIDNDDGSVKITFKTKATLKALMFNNIITAILQENLDKIKNNIFVKTSRSWYSLFFGNTINTLYGTIGINDDLVYNLTFKATTFKQALIANTIGNLIYLQYIADPKRYNCPMTHYINRELDDFCNLF